MLEDWQPLDFVPVGTPVIVQDHDGNTGLAIWRAVDEMKLLSGSLGKVVFWRWNDRVDPMTQAGDCDDRR